MEKSNVRSPYLGEDLPSSREFLLAGLNQQVANLIDLSAAYKQAHWNVTGADFAQLHVLFDQFNGQASDHVDVVAERARALGGSVHGTIQAAVERSVLPAFPLEVEDPRRLLEELVLRADWTAMGLRQALVAGSPDAATQDVYVEVLRSIEKQLWMLRAHLGPSRLTN